MGKSVVINREISWLAFNDRVLSEAEDQSVPLMERLRFLGIFSSNRDEFFRVRVASVKRLAALGESIEQSGEDARELMGQIQAISIVQQQRYESIYSKLMKELEAVGVVMVDENSLNESQEDFVRDYFERKVDPIIGPIILDKVKRFPTLRDKGIYLAVKLKVKSTKKSKTHFALVEVPNTLPRFVALPSEKGKRHIIILDDIIRFNIHEIFPIYQIEKIEAYTFKITRDAELDLDNDISKSFLEKMKKSLKDRKTGAPLRFVFDSSMPKDLQKYLAGKMKLTSGEDAFIPGGRYHNMKDLMSFPRVEQSSLYYKPLKPNQHPYLKQYENDYFTALKKRDVFLQFPYQSFKHVIDLLKTAALDPSVKSIHICLYRVAKQSKIVNALINASRNGKKVVVVFELQARFDEENNIYWSNLLEDEGVKVHFGFPGLKVHSKICLITRKANKNLEMYSVIGTGNYNESTASLYGDYLLMTAKDEITKEVRKVFELFDNAIWPNYRFQHLILSPFYMRNKMVRLVNKEIKNAKAGKNAYIYLKLNSLVDTSLINKLYEASKAGVKVKLIIRGICSLIPGVKGMSENIDVVSIIDRYLEHARCFVFCNSGDPLFYISSADWMVRNIDRRIEITCPIYDTKIKQEIWESLQIQLNDNVKGRQLSKDGVYRIESSEEAELRSQYALYDYYRNL